MKNVEMCLPAIVDDSADSSYDMELVATTTVWKKCVKIVIVKLCVFVEIDDDAIYVGFSVAGKNVRIKLVGDGCKSFSLGPLKIKLCISNYSKTGGKFCFDLAVKACIDIFIGEKCINAINQNICVPVPAQDRPPFGSLSIAEQLTYLQVMDAMLEDDDSGGCACES